MAEEDSRNTSIITQDEQTQAVPLLDVRNKENKFDDLNKTRIWAYGVGHLINDLVAACWFNYLFFFLSKVVKTQAASTAMLAGQVSDGIATPIVGYLSDKTKTRIGQRTPWYIGGLILVISCYIPIYHTFHSDNIGHQYAYYIIFPSLFNFGWASLQISHMSLVPSLTCSRKRRDLLNNLRNTFTFIANFLVLGMGLLIFRFMHDPELEYAIISYIVVTIGLTASLFFLYNIREVPLTQACSEKADQLKHEIQQTKKIKIGVNSNVQFSEDDDSIEGFHLSKRQRLAKVDSIWDWFKMPKFYLFGICYMGVRLCTNMFGTLLPFYLIGVLQLGLNQESSTSIPYTVALVPLIVYANSVMASLRLNWFYKKFGRKLALTIGTVICTISMCSMFALTVETNWVMYIISAFIGLSQTMILATGINFISDVVGTKAKTGAFVFGIYSLLDKISTGLVIFLIGNTEAYKKQDSSKLNEEEKKFIKYTMILIPVFSAILATLIVISYPIEEYSKKSKDIKTRKNSLEDQLVS